MIKNIPDSEFKERQKKVQEKVRENRLDVAIVHSHEADFANATLAGTVYLLGETISMGLKDINASKRASLLEQKWNSKE